MEAPIPRHVAQAYEDEEESNGISTVRVELRQKIHRKHKMNSYEYLVIRESQDNEELSKDDIERRERRKASNRNAARRCREKKMMEHLKLMEKLDIAEKQYDALKLNMQRLKSENERLVGIIKSSCSCKKMKMQLTITPEDEDKDILQLKKEPQVSPSEHLNHIEHSSLSSVVVLDRTHTNIKPPDLHKSSSLSSSPSSSQETHCPKEDESQSYHPKKRHLLSSPVTWSQRSSADSQSSYLSDTVLDLSSPTKKALDLSKHKSTICSE